MWLQGTFSRRLIVRINGRVVGTIHRQIGTAGQFLKVGTVRLQAGEQRVDIVRPDSFYAPGNAVGGELLGPLVLVRGDSPPAGRRDRSGPGTLAVRQEARVDRDRQVRPRTRDRGLLANRCSRRLRIPAPVASGDRLPAMS